MNAPRRKRDRARPAAERGGRGGLNGARPGILTLVVDLRGLQREQGCDRIAARSTGEIDSSSGTM